MKSVAYKRRGLNLVVDGTVYLPLVIYGTVYLPKVTRRHGPWSVVTLESGKPLE